MISIRFYRFLFLYRTIFVALLILDPFELLNKFYQITKKIRARGTTPAQALVKSVAVDGYLKKISIRVIV